MAKRNALAAVRLPDTLMAELTTTASAYGRSVSEEIRLRLTGIRGEKVSETQLPDGRTLTVVLSSGTITVDPSRKAEDQAVSLSVNENRQPTVINTKTGKGAQSFKSDKFRT